MQGSANSQALWAHHVGRQSGFGTEKPPAEKMQGLAAGSRAHHGHAKGYGQSGPNTCHTELRTSASMTLRLLLFSSDLTESHILLISLLGLLFSGTRSAHSFQSGGLSNMQLRKETLATVCTKFPSRLPQASPWVPFPLLTQHVSKKRALFSMW